VRGFETSITTDAEPERVWAIWTDVEGWPRWHPGIAQASLERQFAEGARGSSRAPGGPRSKLRIGPVEPGRTFISETILPLARLRFEHRIEPTGGGGTTMTYGVKMSGPATLLFGRIIGPRLEQRMPEALRGLAELAASQQEPAPEGDSRS
jgi:uncharacterized protein YndB with AHSA1/START domain